LGRDKVKKKDGKGERKAWERPSRFGATNKKNSKISSQNQKKIKIGGRDRL